MGYKFVSGVYATVNAPTWLDDISQVSIFVRFRLDTVDGTKSQFIFRHRLGISGDQFSLRKDVTTNLLKGTTTRNGVAVTSQGSVALVAGTTYTAAYAWKVGANPGSILWQNATQVDSDSTLGQSGNYNTLGGDLVIAARPGSPVTDFGQATLEYFLICPGLFFTQAMVTALQRGRWPWEYGFLTPSLVGVFWPMRNGDLTRIQNMTGRRRSIESSGITGTIQAAGGTGLLGRWPLWPRTKGTLGVPVSIATPPPPPDVWTECTGPNSNPFVPDVQHPIATFTQTGLINGTTYQYKVVAIDGGGNMGPDSNIVNVTPAVPPPLVSQSITPWRRTRRLSKFRPSQNG